MVVKIIGLGYKEGRDETKTSILLSKITIEPVKNTGQMCIRWNESITFEL